MKEKNAQIGLLLLSQSLESRYAAELARLQPKGFGYLLRDRVVNVSLLVDAVNRVASGQTLLDPDVISLLLGRRTRRDQVADLSDRERDVLALVAQGRPNVNDRPRTRAHPQGTVPWPPNNPRALTPLAVDGALESQTEVNAILAKGKRTSHGVHIFLSIITAGVWLLVWPVVWYVNREQWLVLDVDQHGNISAQKLDADAKPTRDRRGPSWTGAIRVAPE